MTLVDRIAFVLNDVRYDTHRERATAVLALLAAEGVPLDRDATALRAEGGRNLLDALIEGAEEAAS